MYLHTCVVAAVTVWFLGTNAAGYEGDLHWVQRLANEYNSTAKGSPPPRAYFDQYIDHKHPEKGTFQQRYSYSTKYYKGPGSPIIFTTPGESSLSYTRYFFNDNIISAKFAKAVGAALIVIEHRYWGTSTPYKERELNTETLQQLTLDNALLDFVNFAHNVRFPFDKQGKSQARKAPWVFTGGSYSGAMAAWMEQLYPGTFWAYHASSAVVQAIDGFWQYFDVIENNSMPTRCRQTMELVTNRINRLLANGTAQEKKNLKSLFGLQNLEYDDDFAVATTYPLYLYQYSPNHILCKHLSEGVGNATSHGDTKVNGALKAYGRLSKFESCPELICWNTHGRSVSDATLFADLQWAWLLCNEPFGWFRTAEPVGQQGIIAQANKLERYRRACSGIFPPKSGYIVGSDNGKTVRKLNAFTHGWNRDPSKRLVWQNSGRDPWLGATVSSPYRPGGPQVSTKQEPVFFTPNGYHVADFAPCRDNDTSIVCKNVAAEVAVIKKWVAEWPGYH